MDHDDANCPHLHAQYEYTVRSYIANKGMIAFETWFNTVLKVQNKMLADSFEFNYATFDGIEMIDVIQHDPSFNIDALESLFEIYRNEPPKLAIVEKKIVVPFGAGLN